MPNPAVKVNALRKVLLGAQLSAARHVRKVVEGQHADSTAPWKEVTGQTRAALILANASLAAERAKTIADAPRGLGVVVVHARLEDTPQNRLSWEQQAARLNEGRVIEAVATPKKEPDGA